VRYDEFRDQLEAALERNSLHFHGLQRVETIELANTVRHWKVYTHGAAPPSTEPFHVSAEIGFAWSLCLSKISKCLSGGKGIIFPLQFMGNVIPQPDHEGKTVGGPG
jgi:hypothetical protein